MPSSLVVTALIVAWLAVLVPVVARRRQLVPRPAEADLCSRVLHRSGGPASMEVAVSGTTTSVRPPIAPRPGGATAIFDRRGPVTGEAEDHVEDRTHGPDVGEHDDGWTGPGSDSFDDHEGHDADGDENQDTDGYDDGYDAAADDLDEERPTARRREFRPGRGGFDPEAALAAADVRYAFRRRVALGLLVAAVLSALLALVITPVLWWLHLMVDLALVGYLVFLRRQTRLEEEVRERRLARMRGDRRVLEARRAERAEHERRLAEVDDWGAWEGDDTGDVTGDHDAHDHEDGDDEEFDGLSDDELLEIDEEDRVVVAADSRRSRYPGRQGRGAALPEGLELVEDTADDPAFHDLDADRMPAYKRAAGA